MSGFLISELTAFVTIDPVDGDEGICAMTTRHGSMPMIGADRDRIESLRPIAQQLADAGSLEIALVRFSRREIVETLRPKETK